MHSSKRIPILGPYEAQCFLKYFKGIDFLLSQRFACGFNPAEEHLTSILCELLDERGSQLHPLEYNASDLNNDLSRNGGLLQANISLETNEFNKFQEHYATQSDLGVILEYQDNIERKNQFTKGILIQAKKLYSNKNLSPSLDYTFESKYESFKEPHLENSQHQKLKSLNNFFIDKDCGKECVKYLMYNPPLERLPKGEQQRILYRQMKLDRNEIFDYISGLNRYRELTEENRRSVLTLGCLFASVDDVDYLLGGGDVNNEKMSAFTLGSLVEYIDVYESSLAWFFVFEFMMSDSGCSCDDFLNLVRYGKQIRTVSDLTIVPPRFSLKIKVTAGVG